MKARKLLSIAVLLALCTAGMPARAQQEIQVSQYMFNQLFLNPAYSGTSEHTAMTGLYRNQWTGLEGAPVTQLFGVDGALAGNTMGLGFTFLNDEIGDTRHTEISGVYSYHLYLNSSGKTRLSFGLRAGVMSFSANLTETFVWDESDPVFSQNQSGELVPKIGAGAMLYHKKWYVGLSVPTLFAADDNIRFNLNNQGGNYLEPHFYINGGYAWEVSNTLVIRPSLLTKFVIGTPVMTDISIMALINKTLWLGATYRTTDALVAILEYNITPQFRIGYAFDYTVSNLTNYNSGTHEAMLGYRFLNKDSKTKTPRYF